MWLMAVEHSSVLFWHDSMCSCRVIQYPYMILVLARRSDDKGRNAAVIWYGTRYGMGSGYRVILTRTIHIPRPLLSDPPA